MNFIEVILGEKLKDQDSALNVTGSDRKVLQVACQDFTSYLKYHWNLIGKEADQPRSKRNREKAIRYTVSTQERARCVTVLFELIISNRTRKSLQRLPKH